MRQALRQRIDDDMANQASQGFFSPFLQRRRLAAASRHFSGSVLDFGCGNGAASPHCDREAYYGYDRDPESIEVARSLRPGYSFSTSLPEDGRTFDTISMLALIEHIADPTALLAEVTGYLAPGGKMVLTTPHPMFRTVHELGARIGLFSHDAADEHETLIDRPLMEKLIAPTGLVITDYRRFLGGANQLFILSRRAN